MPFYVGDSQRDTVPDTVDLNAQSTTVLTILITITGVLAFVSIFLFRNRKVQSRLAYLGVLLRAVLLVLYFGEISHFNRSDIALWRLVYFAIHLFYLPAARGIRNDQKSFKAFNGCGKTFPFSIERACDERAFFMF